ATSLWALRGEMPRYARALAASALAVATLGTLGVIEGQREAAGVSVATLFSTSLGSQAVARLVVLAVLLICGGAALAVRGRQATFLAGIAAAASVAVMWIDVQYSHAGAQAPVWANYMAQIVHIAAAGVWMGGLVLLLFALRAAGPGERVMTARRFSVVFGVCIALVGVTGTFRAIIEIGSWSLLVSSAFGVLVIVKSGLFLVLAALGAVNRWMHVPNANVLMRRFGRFVGTEVVTGVAVIAVAAALVNVAPPIAGGLLASAPQQQTQEVVVTGSDFATTVRMTLTITPGVAGFNTFTAKIADYNTGAPVDASAVTLQFSNPLRPNVAPSSLSLQRQSPGVFSARGANLSLDGIWAVQAVIENGLASTEVQLQLVTDEPPPQTTQTLIPSGTGNQTETVYTIQLSKGRTAQVYLQQSGPLYEFHVTMFTAGGNGEVQTSAMTIGETLQGGAPTILVSRRLDPVGHWVADASKPKGATRFDIIATLPTGEVLATYVIMDAAT
ncbi:MAG: FixH family protein, partial [Candidatus Dormibacteraeota bacterium]|nr:FixH family protein [Candidatus Dormibacteraeota bacterium]